MIVFSMPVIFVSLFWLAFLASCELTAEILNLVFLFFQLWKFQQKYRYIMFVIKDVLEEIGVTYFLSLSI